jgi:hypothetical protein
MSHVWLTRRLSINGLIFGSDSVHFREDYLLSALFKNSKKLENKFERVEIIIIEFV